MRLAFSLCITWAKIHNERWEESMIKNMYNMYVTLIQLCMYLKYMLIEKKKDTGMHSCVNNNFLKVIFIFLFILFYIL